MPDPTPDLVAALPAAATIRARLDALRAEARVLRDLLTIAERRERQSARGSAPTPPKK
jgi:hypothetical protein